MANTYKTFTAGSVLTAADLNTYLMRQAVIACDSSADYPSSAIEGMCVYDRSLDTLLTYSGSAWIRTGAVTTTGVQTWSPTITQSSGVAATITSARYVRQGCLVTAWANLAITGSGTAGNGVDVSLPVAASGHTLSATDGDVIGSARYYRASTTTSYGMAAVLRSATGVGFLSDATAQSELGGVGLNFGLASGDRLQFTVQYTA